MKHEEAVRIKIEWNLELQFVKSFKCWCKKKLNTNTNYRANRDNTLYTTTNCLQTGKYFKTIKYFLTGQNIFVSLKQKIFSFPVTRSGVYSLLRVTSLCLHRAQINTVYC